MADEEAPLVQRCRYLRDAEVEARAGFVRKVYGILSSQLLITCIVATLIQRCSHERVQANSWLLCVSTAALLGCILAMACHAHAMRTYPTNYAFLAVLTLCLSINVGFASAMYTWQSVALAAAMAAVVFLGLSVYASTAAGDLTGAGPYLCVALLCLGGFGLALSVLRLCGVSVGWATMLCDALGVLLFAFYIVHDTQQMLGGDYKVQLSIDDYCFASLNLYLDIINVFLHLLRLVGRRQN